MASSGTSDILCALSDKMSRLVAAETEAGVLNRGCGRVPVPLKNDFLVGDRDLCLVDDCTLSSGMLVGVQRWMYSAQQGGTRFVDGGVVTSAEPTLFVLAFPGTPAPN